MTVDAPTEMELLRQENAELRRRLERAASAGAALADGPERGADRRPAIPSPPPPSPGEMPAPKDLLWRAIFEEATDGMLLANDTHYVNANRSACELLGVAREQLIGRPRDDWAWPGSDDAPQTQIFVSNETTFGYFCVAHPGGRTREIEYSTSAHIVPGLHLSILRDVTERKNAERERLNQQELFQQVMDAIEDMVFVKGPGSRLLWANKAFCEAYGMSAEALKGLIDAPFVPPDLTAQYVRDDLQVFETGRPVHIPEEMVNRHDGRVIHVHTVKSPIFDSLGRVTRMVGLCRDVTRQRQMEMDLRQAQKLEAVGTLASGIAHEINTPVQFIGDQTQFLKEAFRDLGPLRDAYSDLLAKIEAGKITAADAARVRAVEEAADVEFLFQQIPGSIAAVQDGVSRVARLVQAMKEFGHPDRRDRSDADLNHALRTTLILANNQLKYVADVETDFGDLPQVACWVGELNQVFLNILVNAGHAIADALVGTPGGRGKVRIVTRKEADLVVVSIGDTGGGIPAAVQDRIFEPFFTTKEVGRGTGQGLAIARRIVEKHGGSLTFETTPGVGTTFHVSIPASPGGTPSAPSGVP